MLNGTKSETNGKTPQTERKSENDRFKFSDLQFPSPKNQHENKFRWLIEVISLLLFQLVSLTTTLDGAKLLFRDVSMPFLKWLPIAYVLGFGIQLLMAAILIVNAFEEKPIRRLFALLFLAAFSIYTNFFSIYNLMTGGLLEKNTSIDLAQRKYEQLVVYFYTNPKNELDSLEQKAAKLNCSLYQEDPEGTPQPEGCPNRGYKEGKGPLYEKYKEELDEVNAELSNLDQDYIRKTAPNYFDKSVIDSLEQKDARGIFDLSQKALSVVPAPIKENAIAQDYNPYNPEAYDDVFNFFPEKGTSNFLIPGQKVFNKESRETVAVVAFVLAAAIDAISLWLGAELNGFYGSLKRSLSNINPLADILNGLFNFLEDIGKAVVPFIEAPLVYVGKIWFSFAEGVAALITSVFNGFGVLLISLLNGIVGLFKDIVNSLRHQSPGKKLRLESKNGDGVEFLDTFYNAIIRGRSELLDEDFKNSQLYKALISDMKDKGYFEDSSVTNNNPSYRHYGSRPKIFEPENRQPDLILKPERQKAFHDWYVNQRNLQLEREQRNVGNKNRSLNTINFPPNIREN